MQFRCKRKNEEKTNAEKCESEDRNSYPLNHSRFRRAPPEQGVYCTAVPHGVRPVNISLSALHVFEQLVVCVISGLFSHVPA